MNQTDTRVLNAQPDIPELPALHRSAKHHLNTSRLSAWLLIVATLFLSGLYMAKYLKRGYFPRDEGTLAQSAERVLRGEMPHRDFDEGYTGGESYLNAAAFRLFGTDLVSIRYIQYPFFLLWILCLLSIGFRFVPRWMAASITLLCVAWGPPNYTSPMPSWYNLFFATYGVAALFRYMETDRRRWLLVAGLCGGISFLFKLSGMYYVAGVILFLLFAGAKSSPDRFPRRAGTALVVVCVVAYEGLVLSLLAKASNAGSFLYFSLPILVAGLVVIWERLQPEHADDSVGVVLKNLLWFGGGVAIPILLFLIPFIEARAVADFLRGIFILPGKYLSTTIRTESLPRFLVGTAADGIVIAVLLGTAGKKLKTVAGVLLIVAGAVVTVLARRNATVYDAAWVPIWNFLPLVVVGGLVLLMRKKSNIPVEQRRKTFLLLAVTAAFNLIQFPYCAPVYFCYVAPLLILCVVAIGRMVDAPPRPVLAGFFCICLLYAVFDLTPWFLVRRGEPAYVKSGMMEVALPRAYGLHIYGEEARIRAELVNVISQHARGKYIYATPDCPEVYFLSGFANPTRTFFDFVDDPTNRTERILASLHAHDVSLVVLELSPGFSGEIPPDLKQALEQGFPERALVGHFEVRWKP